MGNEKATVPNPVPEGKISQPAPPTAAEFRKVLWRHRGNGETYRVLGLVAEEVLDDSAGYDRYTWRYLVCYVSVKDLSGETQYHRTVGRFRERFEPVERKAAKPGEEVKGDDWVY